MKKLIEHQDWDFHSSDSYNYLDGDKIVGSYDIHYYEMENGDISSCKLVGLYIQPEYRGKGLAHQLMKDILDVCNGKDIFLEVKKDSWVVNFYRKYGFKWNARKDDDFRWMKRKKNSKQC